MEDSSSCLHYRGPPLSVRLNVETEEEKQSFLKAILPSFLQNVDPWLSGLLDHMISAGVVTDGDRESLDGHDVVTPRDLRRKVWFHLCQLTVPDLRTKVFPKLYQDYPHIIPEKFLTQRAVGSPTSGEEEGEEGEGGEAVNKGCFRHSILPRIRPKFLVDKMYQYGVIDLERYGQLFQGRHGGGGAANTQTVEKLLAECLAFSHSPQLLPMMKAVLEEHQAPVPVNLPWLLTSGFPCAGCPIPSLSLTSTTPPSVKKVDSWLRKLTLWRTLSCSGSTRSTESTGVCSTVSSGGFPPLSQSAASNSPFSASSANEACPPPQGCPEKHVALEMLDKGLGESGTGSGVVCKESPHISVRDECHTPPAGPEVVSSDSVALHMPASTPPVASQRVNVGRGQGEVSSENVKFHLEGSTEELVGASSQPRPFFGMPMLVFSEIRKFMMRHRLGIMPFVGLVIVSVIILSLTGFNIFQMISGSRQSSEQILTEVKQQQENLIKNVTSVFEQVVEQQEKRLIKNVTSILCQLLKLNGSTGTADLVKSSEN